MHLPQPVALSTPTSPAVEVPASHFLHLEVYSAPRPTVPSSLNQPPGQNVQVPAFLPAQPNLTIHKQRQRKTNVSQTITNMNTADSTFIVLPFFTRNTRLARATTRVCFGVFTGWASRTFIAIKSCYFSRWTVDTFAQCIATGGKSNFTFRALCAFSVVQSTRVFVSAFGALVTKPSGIGVFVSIGTQSTTTIDTGASFQTGVACTTRTFVGPSRSCIEFSNATIKTF
jgi:hypothetical protein